MLAFALWLLFLLRTALAGPAWEAAPVETERPEVQAPVGGWWTEDGLHARVLAGPDDHATARRLADHVAGSLPRLAARLGVSTGGTIDIYIAPTQAEFASIQPGTPPDWADGTAWPRWGMVFLRSPSIRPGTAEPLEQVLDHELVHVLVGRAFAPSTPPRWLQEGLAQYFAGELGPETTHTLATMLFGRDDLLELSKLSRGFYGGPSMANKAYAASADFIGHLSGHYGPRAVPALVATMARGGTLEDAVQAATGRTLAQVEAEWRGGWADPAMLSNALMSADLLWGVAGVLVVVGAWRARRRTKRTLDRWEQEERWVAEREAAATRAPSLGWAAEPQSPWMH